MRFKAPRCADTDPGCRKIRDVLPEENIRCQVGSGECLRLAVESQDNGEGGEFFVCAEHSIEFKALATLAAEMTMEQIVAFETAIQEAELNATGRLK